MTRTRAASHCYPFFTGSQRQRGKATYSETVNEKTELEPSTERKIRK